MKRRLESGGCRLGPGRTTTGRRELYDTFDQRLFRNQCLLAHDPGAAALCLLNAAGGELWRLDNAAAAPRFHWDLDSSDLAARLASLVKECALLPLGCFIFQEERQDLVNRHGKIVARLCIERMERPAARAGEGAPVLQTLRLQALRGYENKTKKLFSLAAESCARPTPQENPLAPCLAALGKSPQPHPAALRVRLDRSMTTRQALAKVLLFLLDAMERNATGIRDDIDTAFLRRFRVAGRRSRSLVNAMKHVLPPRLRTRAGAHFAWLSGQTSELRDCDVFLLALRRRRQLLPADVCAGLAPLQDLLQQQRETARRRLLGALDSERRRDFIRAWRECLQQEFPEEAPKRLDGPALPVAGAAVGAAWKKLRRCGRRAEADGADPSLHELRKAGKKLRYLLEAFRSLFPENDVKQALKQLRRLQNVLGEIVDCQVQQQFLQERRDLFAEAAHRGVRAAMEHLGEIHSDREAAAKQDFRSAYKEFMTADNRRLFRSFSRDNEDPRLL